MANLAKAKDAKPGPKVTKMVTMAAELPKEPLN